MAKRTVMAAEEKTKSFCRHRGIPPSLPVNPFLRLPTAMTELTRPLLLRVTNTDTEDRAVVQAASCRSLTAKVRVQSYAICVGQIPRVLCPSPVTIIPTALHTREFIYHRRCIRGAQIPVTRSPGRLNVGR